MTNLNEDIDLENFKIRLREILKDRPDHTSELQEKFVSILFKNLPLAFDVKNYLLPDNDSLLNISRLISRFQKDVEQLANCKERFESYKTLESLVALERKSQNKSNITVEDILDYALSLHNHINGFIAHSSKPNKDNRLALMLCIFVAQIYQGVFKLKPASKTGNYVQQTGDIMDGSPYERICFLLAEFLEVEILWNTTRTALNSAMNGVGVYNAELVSGHNN